MDTSHIVIILLCCLSAIKQVSSESLDDKVSLLNDFVDLENVPITLTIMTCWDEGLYWKNGS